MKILHIKKSNIAQAPDELSKAIEKYTNHISSVSGKEEEADVLHFHNKYKKTDHPHQCIQYHSEPFRVDLDVPLKNKLVIAQYHATLEEYSDCRVVRNIIDYNQDTYALNWVDDKIKVGYSPSIKTNPNYWYNKGYISTQKILHRLKVNFPNQFDYDIIHGVPLDECLERKRKCNIIIDECVTTSYHRSALEGLALGKMTICSIGPEVEKVFIDAAGTDFHPLYNVQIENLYFFLVDVIEKGVGWVLNMGSISRDWMENYWNPEDIVNEFMSIYETL